MKQKQYKVVGVKAVEYNKKYTIEIWIQASAHILADIGNVCFENNNKELLRSAYNGDCFHVVQFAGIDNVAEDGCLLDDWQAFIDFRHIGGDHHEDFLHVIVELLFRQLMV